MDSSAGALVAAFGGFLCYGLLCGAAFLYALGSSSSADANFGARALSANKITQTYTFLTSR